MYEWLYLTWITNKDLLRRELCSVFCKSLMVFRPERLGEEIVREFGMDMNTLLYLTWRTSKDLLDSTGNSAQCHVAACLGGEFGEGGEWIRICMAESLCCLPETITAL